MPATDVDNSVAYRPQEIGIIFALCGLVHGSIVKAWCWVHFNYYFVVIIDITCFTQCFFPLPPSSCDFFHSGSRMRGEVLRICLFVCLFKGLFIYMWKFFICRPATLWLYLFYLYEINKHSWWVFLKHQMQCLLQHPGLETWLHEVK